MPELIFYISSVTQFSFAMPAIYDSLVASQGLTPHKAWRVAYVVPFIIITAVALGMVFFCDDTPTGKWSERHLFAEGTNVTTLTSSVVETAKTNKISSSSVVSETVTADKEEKNNLSSNSDLEGRLEQDEEIVGYREEMVVAPTLKEALRVILSISTLSLAGNYFCTFGAELALDAILGSYYASSFKSLGQTESGRWAAMFGLLNIVFRPLGGYISDILYHQTHSVWVKKTWLTFLVIVNGVFLLAIGLQNPKNQSTMFGLVAGLAFFMEAANGANFSVVPHVHPFANGMLLHYSLLLTLPTLLA
jgi:NNP family nitrate/nitrite transporter-like MFS transporter